MLEELALGGLGEAVELKRVLAHVKIGLERHLAAALGQAERRRRHRQRVADAADVEHEPLARASRPAFPQARDHNGG